MISVHQALFADGQTHLVKECEFAATQFNENVELKSKSEAIEQIEVIKPKRERMRVTEDFSLTHLQCKTNISDSPSKPNTMTPAEGSENKFINLVVVRKKKKNTKNAKILNSKKESKLTSGNTVALCYMCGKNFSSNFNLKRHMTSCKLCPEEDKGPRFQCQCGRTYSQEWDMKKHRLSCQDNAKKCKSCLFPFCNLLFYHRSQLLAHVKNVHNVSIREPEVLDFESMDEFKAWKERVEEDTYTYYSKQTGSNVTGVSVNTYYVCQHDGSDRTHSSTPRKTDRRNKKGRVKTGQFCWSQMNVKELRDSGIVRVTFYPSHTHPVSAADTEHHPLPSSITSEIQRRLSDMKQEDSDSLVTSYSDYKKSRKKNYSMNVRSLRALARKNRKLFRITAEAIDGADDVKVSEETEEQQPRLEDEGTFLLVTEDESHSVQEQVQTNGRPEDIIESCSSYWNDLKRFMSSGKLNTTMISQIEKTLAGLVENCNEEFARVKQETSLAPTVFPIPDHHEANLPLQHDESRVYQVVTLGTKEEPMSPTQNDLIYQNAVELLGPREFIIIANDQAPIFQSVSSSQLSLN